MTQPILFDYWRSSASYRVRIGLNLLGIAYDAMAVDLVAGQQREEDYRRRNPQGLVPTLEIDGLSLTQSMAILEYLEETRAPGWLPRDPAGRARVRALAYAVAMDIHPVCNLRVATFAVQASEGKIATEDWMRHFIRLGLEGLEGLLRQRPETTFCHEDRVSLADICLVPQIYNATRWAVPIDDLTRISAVVARLEGIPAFLDAHPDRVRIVLPERQPTRA